MNARQSQAIASHPEAIDALLSAAVQQVRALGGNSTPLGTLLSTALKESSLPEETQALLTIAATAEGRLEQAETLVRTAIERSPGNADLHTQMGYIQLQYGKLSQARTSFERALSLQPNHAQAFRGIADTLLRQENWAGAFLHYRSLYEKGLEDAALIDALETCAAHLQADYWDPQLANTVLSLIEHPDSRPRAWAPLANTLLIRHYRLDVPDAQIDLNTLASDMLFLQVLAKGLILSPEVEQTATAVRTAILAEAAETGTLRESLQALAFALGMAAAQSGYVWPVAQEEQQVLNLLDDQIRQALFAREPIETVVGATLILAMYQSLYSSVSAPALLGTEPDHWPDLLEPLMDKALWQPANIHARCVDLRQHMLKPRTVTEAMSHEDRLPWPTIAAVRIKGPRQSLHDLLCAQLGTQVLNFEKRPLNVLVTECQTGQRPAQLASQFSDVHVTGVDPVLVNIAAAQSRPEAGRFNIRFLPLDLQQLGALNARPDVLECARPLNQLDNPLEAVRAMARVVNPQGLVKLKVTLFDQDDPERIVQTLVQEQFDQRHIEGVRALRHAIMQDTHRADWLPILSDPAFYSLEGVRDRFFRGVWHYLEPHHLDELIKSTGLKLIGLIHAGAHSSLYRQPESVQDWYAKRAYTLKKPIDLVIYAQP